MRQIHLVIVSCLGTILPLFTAGCFPPPGADGADGNAGKPVGEPNNSFAQAIPVEYDQAGSASLQGSIETEEDVDVFDLGPVQPGDRITADVAAQNTGLDAAIAIFDANGRLFVENDDRNLLAGLLDPFADQAARLASDRYFLAIAASPFGAGTGQYDIAVTIQRGGPIPPAVPQVFFLDFDGGNIDIPDEDIGAIGPFNTADIADAYAGMTAAVRSAIITRFEDAYQGLDVITVTSEEGEAAAGPTFSRILFGGFDPTKFGISQSVDQLNAVRTDQAIIFTQTFRPSLFGRTLNANELGTAIGNVAAHEAGHLLGLNHVTDITALMDTTGGPDTLLIPQIFKEAPLADSIFPIGTQDAWLLLQLLLGFA